MKEASEAFTARTGFVPDTVSVEGADWEVRRAWPASRNRIAFEAAKDGGGIRAGYLGDNGVELLAPGRDPKLPGLERLLAHDRAVQLISHRPGKRAVVRLPDGCFAKCVRPGRAGAIIAGQRRAGAFAAGFELPEVLVADDSTVTLSRLPGVELHDPARLGENWQRAWTECLESWTLAGKEAPHRNDSDSPVHTAASELHVLNDWRERAAGLLGSLRHRLDALIAEVSDELIHRATEATEAVPGREPGWGPIHRDLHDKQLMWDPVAGPGMLDVDTACRGERELDLGNLAAHARWRCAQGIWTEADAEVVLDAIGTATSASGSVPARVRTYERSALLRLVCVYAFRPRYSDHIGVLLDAAHSEAGATAVPVATHRVGNTAAR